MVYVCLVWTERGMYQKKRGDIDSCISLESAHIFAQFTLNSGCVG